MDESYIVENSRGLPSPCLIFYEEAIRANHELAIGIAGSPGRLRPHVKTHKTREIALIAMSMGIDKFKCATIAEAEMLALAGAGDVLLAYQLVGKNAERLITLVRHYPRTLFSTLVDDRGIAARLDVLAAEAGVRLGVLLDLDVGQHRTGIEAGKEAEELYAFIAMAPSLRVAGLHCYDGQNHQAELGEREKATAEARAIMEPFRARLLAAGLPVPETVAGGTPTFPCHARHNDVILSPGTCFLNDLGCSTKYTDMPFALGALLLTRVSSLNRSQGTFCLDLGYKALSSDAKAERGMVLNMPSCETMIHSEEHWVLRAKDGWLPALGDEAYVLPTHICPTIALHERAYVVEKGRRWSTEWRITARDRVLGA